MTMFNAIVPFHGKRDAVKGHFVSQGLKDFMVDSFIADELPANALLFDVEEEAKRFILEFLFAPEEKAEVVDVEFLDEFEIRGESVGWEVVLEINETA